MFATSLRESRRIFSREICRAHSGGEEAVGNRSGRRSPAWSPAGTGSRGDCHSQWAWTAVGRLEIYLEVGTAGLGRGADAGMRARGLSRAALILLVL